MTEPNVQPSATEKSKQTPQVITRFDIVQRIEHIVLLTSFSMLGITGLPQKYPTSSISDGILRFFGGIEIARQIHHVSAIILMIISIVHIISVLYRIIVLRAPLSMLPWIDDFVHLFHDVQYYLGLRKHRAYYGRFNYAEKAEYLAVVWGTVVMAITGFMMWNPIVTARVISGEAIPAAKAAHGGEAVLAVAAIILWHFYHVHIKQFNKSMFTGKLTHEEMKEEHPAELAKIEANKSTIKPPAAAIQKRQRIFIPAAAVLTVFFGVGLVGFVTLEKTAITTVPIGETVKVYVPLTPTPRPTLAPTPTMAPGASVAANTWKGAYAGLFKNRCGGCHVSSAVGGFSLATYQSALKGGKSGPGIIPGDPDNSVLVQIQSIGSHPGQLTVDELQQVIDWIKAGAPEQ